MKMREMQLAHIRLMHPTPVNWVDKGTEVKQLPRQPRFDTSSYLPEKLAHKN